MCVVIIQKYRSENICVFPPTMHSANYSILDGRKKQVKTISLFEMFVWFYPRPNANEFSKLMGKNDYTTAESKRNKSNKKQLYHTFSLGNKI